MRGSYRVIVQNKRIRYDFEIRRNITVIRGDSATGKTALVDMVREHFENGAGSAVSLVCEKNCAVVEGRTWMGQLSEIQDSIIFIDEGNEFVMSDAFSDAIQKTDNYYVIVSREGIPSLPYSVDEIYGIRNSGKYGTLQRTYNEFYHIYSGTNFDSTVRPDMVITEDSNSGHQFFEYICRKSDDIVCVSANGKSNIFALAANQSAKSLLIIADGAAFGSEMEKLMELVKNQPDIVLYLPESFEWMILKSGIIEDNSIDNILENPEEYIESREYFSWERFFTAFLIQCTKGTYLKYSKRKLNIIYLQGNTPDKLLDVMDMIQFK